MEYLLVRLTKIENRIDITDDLGNMVGMEAKFKFLTDRGVVVDDEPEGQINQTIELEPGRHTLTLAPPNDFTPQKMEIVLNDTTAIAPLEVHFEKI